MKLFNKLVLSIIMVTSFSLTQITYAEDIQISQNKIDQIERSVNSMNVKQLTNRMAVLNDEIETLENAPVGGANAGSRVQMLAEKYAELSAIQKALVALLGVGALSALTDSDDYNDVIPPVITILGDNPATVELGSTYTDAGATAMDAFHGSTPVSTSGAVDTSTVGSYTITYVATDLDNNSAIATRTVNVVDTTAPVITITGDNPATVELGSTYTDAGATASDASGSITVTSTGTVDGDTVGAYNIVYSASDASGNTSTSTRVVNVTDTVAPVFTSSATFTIDENTTAVGTVTATDLTAVTFTVSGTELSITAGGVLTFIVAPDYESQPNPLLLPYDGSTYDITATVTATDANSNAATQDITVKVRDVGGIDDNSETGTGTSTSTSDPDTATATSTSTSTSTSTTTSTSTSTSTSTGSSTSTSTGT